LAQRLRLRGFRGPAVEQALDELLEDGSLSDRRFAEGLTRRRIEQGYGPNRIRMELQQVGIDAGDVAATSYDWDVVLEKAHRKKFGEHKPTSPRDFAARMRYLLQRGFTAEQIHRLLRRLDSLEQEHSCHSNIEQDF
jgi:regulatory protein